MPQESFPLELVPCRLEELLTQEVERYRRLSPRHLFELSLEESCPPEIMVDQKRMGEVLENLMSNAAKYTPPGGASVSGDAGPTAAISSRSPTRGSG